MILSTEAIVLKSRKYGDSSKLVSLFTYEKGVITVIAKGARNSKSKFGSSVQPMSIIYTNIYIKPNRDLHILSKAELVVPLGNIRRSMSKLAVGMAMMESIIQSQENDHANYELYDLLKNKLNKLNSIEIHPFTIFISFQIKLAELMGFGIDLTGVNGNQQIMTFLYSEGTFLAKNAYDLENSFILNKNSIEIIKNIYNKNGAVFNGMDIAYSTIEQIVNFFSGYFSYHLEKRFNYNSLSLMNEQNES